VFSPKKIAANIRKVEKDNNLVLKENSVKECIAVFDHFQSISKMEGKRAYYCREAQSEEEFVFAPWELAWIKNELMMCACSFPYWFYRYFFLKDKENRIRRPDVLIAQKIYMDILAEKDELNLPMLFIILKARQLGMSSITEAVILWIALFRRGSHTLISSAEESKSIQMSEMIWIALENLPQWMKPRLTREDRTKGPEFGDIDSDVLIQHGAQTKGIGRGSTPIAAHLCLRGDSLVDVGNGDLKEIQHIRIGDTVITDSGARAEVSAISVRPVEGREVVEVRTWLNRERISLTADHKVFTKDGWKPAGELTKDDWIGTPVRKITGKLTHLLSPDIRDSWGKKKRGKCSEMLILLDEEMGFVFGYYLAEGCLIFNPQGASMVNFALHQSEKAYADRAIKAMQPFTAKINFKHRPGTKTAIIQAYGSSFSRFIHEHFGCTDKKRIPEWVFETNHEFLRGIVAGYFSGDGSKSNTGLGAVVSATSVRPRILYQIRHILASLGYGWGGITTEKAFIDHRGWNNSKSWTLTISGKPAQIIYDLMGVQARRPYTGKGDFVKKYELTPTHIWTKIKSVLPSSANEVWDIEVNHPDHSFETVIGVVANSECAYYGNAIESIEASLLNSMHENPRTFLVLESTAKRKGDWFHRKWLYNRSHESDGYQKFLCLFLPWYVGRDIYPTDDWLRNHPIPKNYEPSKEALEQAQQAALYVASQPILQKYLGQGWEMPIEQIWHWQFRHFEALEDQKYGDGELMKKFVAEMAADEYSCFQSKRDPVYKKELTDRLRSNVRPHLYDVAIVGSGIDRRFHLTEYHTTQKRHHIDWMTFDDQHRSWQLVPLKGEYSEREDFFLRIWDEPKRGYNYTVGVDIAGGGGGDHSCIEVLRVGENGKPDVQVAQLYSKWVSSQELPPFCLAIGLWYGKFMEPLPQAKMAPETQIAVGDPISYQLPKEGYTNFHRMRRYDTPKSASNRGGRMGWATVGWSRQLMLDYEKLAIEAGWLQINSLRTIEELEGLESDETETGRTRHDHSSTTYSDSIFGLGIAHFVSHDEETLAQRMGGALPRVQEEPQEERTEQRESVEAIFGRTLMLEERMREVPTDDELDFVF
jgi:hypothetical protein